uniref:Uncharacterized protein n=1 Tax=Avena sativa TaxID=4498 RepID=A0ACD6A1E7_AVESA
MGHFSHKAAATDERGHTSLALLENLRALSSLATAASLHSAEEDPVFDAPVRDAVDLRAPCRRREMDAVCEECGDVGVQDLLLRCSKCKSAARHRYCLDTIIFDSIIKWLCSDCIPKHNEAIKSLEGATNQRQQRNIQFGSSIIMEPNAEKEKLTITPGLHRNRAHRKRKNHVDESTIHSPSRDTSNRGRNRPLKERGDAITTQSCSGDALYSCAIFGRGIPNRGDCEKVGEDRNGHLICTMGSFDGSGNLALDHALEVEPNNLQEAMCGFKLSSNSAECPDLPDVRSGCFVSSDYVEGSVPQGRKGDIVSPINDVKGSHPMIEDKSHPRAASVEQVDISSVNREKSEPLKAVKGLEKSVVASTFAPDRSKLMQGSHLKTGNADVLKPQRLDSWSRVPMQSSLSNELEDSTVQENDVEGTMRLADELTVTPILKNRTSNPSMANECLVSNEGNSAEENRRSDEVLLSKIHNKMQRRKSVVREIVNSCKVNGISDPDSAQGDPDASIAGMTSHLGPKKRILKGVLQEEGINSKLLPSKFVGPCESTKTNPRKREQSESYTPDGIKYRKASIINENKNVNAARSKSRIAAPVASLRGCQNMPRKDDGSSDKVIGHSKKEKDKKIYKSWLTRKASKGSRKTASDLQPSSLRSSVDKSISYSENMDLALKESSCPVNNPRGSCAARVAEISSTTKELHDDSEPKRRRRPILSSCDDGHVRRPQRKCVEKAAKNPRRYVEQDEEGLRSGNLNQQRSNYYKKVKKQRNLNAGCSENDVSQLALQTGVTEDRSDVLRMPLDKAYWTGIMEIDKNYIPLSAHLSTKAGKKVQELSRSLPPMMKVTKLSTLKSCPKHLEAPVHSADSIDLYFFCGDTRPNKELDQLVKHVADSGIILEAIVGLAKLCLFPSFVLPEEYQTFQGKPYLWGLFNPRKDEIKRFAPVEQDCTTQVTEEEHVQEQHVLDQQDKAHGDIQDQVVRSKKQPLVGASREVINEALSDNVLPLIDMKAIVPANTSPYDHGQPYSNPEARPLKLCGFVVSRTPKSAQLIQEMQKEGAILFAVQQVATEPGSVVGSEHVRGNHAVVCGNHAVLCKEHTLNYGSAYSAAQ